MPYELSRISLSRDGLEAYNRKDERPREEHLPYRHRLMKIEETEQHGTYCTDTGPYGISRAQREHTYGLQQ